LNDAGSADVTGFMIYSSFICLSNYFASYPNSLHMRDVFAFTT
jgi:hypothetical protein